MRLMDRNVEENGGGWGGGVGLGRATAEDFAAGKGRRIPLGRNFCAVCRYSHNSCSVFFFFFCIFAASPLLNNLLFPEKTSCLQPQSEAGGKAVQELFIRLNLEIWLPQPSSSSSSVGNPMAAQLPERGLNKNIRQ